MKRRLFVGVDPLLSDNNFDFAFMTEAEVKQAEKESDTVYEYLTVRHGESWFEVVCSEKNLAQLETLCKAMKEELN